MIVFGLEEEDHEAIGPGEQQTIDEYNVRDILDEMKQKDLKREVLATERLGVKINGRIRPVRVEFRNAITRETACRNARELKHSIPYRNVISISRDKPGKDCRSNSSRRGEYSSARG